MSIKTKLTQLLTREQHITLHSDGDAHPADHPSPEPKPPGITSHTIKVRVWRWRRHNH